MCLGNLIIPGRDIYCSLMTENLILLGTSCELLMEQKCGVSKE